MINIRYHIVSITAVFLALGIGVALGSTFLDRATVDVLDRNIHNAESRIDATEHTNAELKSDLQDAQERNDSLILLASEDLLADHLTDVPVLVITAPGVDLGDVDALSTVLERTGADLRGTLQLEDKLTFGGDVDTDLATDLGMPDASASELEATVRGQLTEALASAGAPATKGAKGGGPRGEQPSIVTTLLDHGYLGLKPSAAHQADDPVLETTGYRYVLVGEPGLDPADDDALLSLLPTGEDADPLPAVVVAATPPHPARGEQRQQSVVDRLRSDGDLRDDYSSVDDLDTFSGIVSTVYVLQQIDELKPDHYGQGDGASSVLPPVP